MISFRSGAKKNNRKHKTHVILCFQNPGEHIGEVFQDEQNMAAILMRRQLENGDLLMVSVFAYIWFSIAK